MFFFLSLQTMSYNLWTGHLIYIYVCFWSKVMLEIPTFYTCFIPHITDLQREVLPLACATNSWRACSKECMSLCRVAGLVMLAWHALTSGSCFIFPVIWAKTYSTGNHCHHGGFKNRSHIPESDCIPEVQEKNVLHPSHDISFVFTLPLCSRWRTCVAVGMLPASACGSPWVPGGQPRTHSDRPSTQRSWLHQSGRSQSSRSPFCSLAPCAARQCSWFLRQTWWTSPEVPEAHIT